MTLTLYDYDPPGEPNNLLLRGIVVDAGPGDWGYSADDRLRSVVTPWGRPRTLPMIRWAG